MISTTQSSQFLPQLTVSLTPCVDPLDMELAVHVLDLSGLLKVTTVTSLSASSPLWPDPLKILCRLSWTVKQVLEVASTMLKLIYRLEIPHHRLCLRKCTLPECSPGPLLEPTSQLSSFRNPHQGVLLQLLEESMSPVSVPSSVSLSTVTNLASTSSSTSSRSGIFLFLRRWYPSTLTFSSSMFEVFIPPGSSRLKYWCATVEQICETHQIALDRFRFTACKFPGLLHCLAMEPEIASNSDKCQTWIALSSSDLDRLMPVNGQVVYFKDADEPCLKLTPEELQSYRVGPSWDSCSQDKPASMPALTYGPTLPPSYSDLTHTFGSNSVKRTYEQPLRIYTAEDHPPAPRATTKPT
ncbi:hypothetical protein FGIG_11184 [Fasciola gigantica]|uniref:Uncharacterized protein n=1 Tax=Fasciola gigantica TaxID=46835 RepID=A0A504YPS3_FASGI|nr:hypothetical protein FGIG_11184 [Fasciola gigantica]